MVVLVVIVGNDITTTKETKEEAQEIDESKYAVQWFNTQQINKKHFTGSTNRDQRQSMHVKFVDYLYSDILSI